MTFFRFSSKATPVFFLFIRLFFRVHEKLESKKNLYALLYYKLNALIVFKALHIKLSLLHCNCKEKNYLEEIEKKYDMTNGTQSTPGLCIRIE